MYKYQNSPLSKEFYLRDHTGKELAIYDWVTQKLKMINLYGNGLIGKVNVTFDAQNNRTDSRQYYFKDHLGSIRMIINGASFDIDGAQDFYPYGEVLRQYTTGSNVNDKYKFTEKERDTETNYDYFGARYYDSQIGRWLQVDPLADKYPGLSPYNYTLNNPLKYFDPNGKEVKGYSERLNSFNGGKEKFIAAIAGSRHAYIRVSTPTRDVILELWGPSGSDRGRLQDNQPGDGYLNGRWSPAEFKIYRPFGVGPDDFSFENQIFEIFEIMKKILPKYDGFGTNSNGFIRFLIETAGGALELPDFCYYADTEEYEKAYKEYLISKKVEEKENIRTRNNYGSARFVPYSYDPFE